MMISLALFNVRVASVGEGNGTWRHSVTGTASGIFFSYKVYLLFLLFFEIERLETLYMKSCGSGQDSEEREERRW
jgi:hypothetical protein